jgi:hypothetical protein
MATIDSKEFVDNIVSNNGYYNGDSDNRYGDNPRAVKIVEYTNAWGNKAYGVMFENDRLDKYSASEFVINPSIYWEFNSKTN